MCSTADCRCKCFVSPHFWNLATALFSLKDITIRSYCRCQLPIGSLSLDQACENTSNTCWTIPKALLPAVHWSLSVQAASFLHRSPILLPSPPTQTLWSLPDSLVPWRAVSLGDATLQSLSRSGAVSVGLDQMLFSSLVISEASLNKLCLKIFCHFSWPQGNPWAWEVKRQHLLSYASGV